MILCFVASFFPLAGMAGGGHDHGHSHATVTQGQAEDAAMKRVMMLAEKGKIDSSWKSVAVENSVKKKYGNRMEWVVSFKNENIEDQTKQTLYIFLSTAGKYIAANYSGK
jgi:hypothetical protein